MLHLLGAEDPRTLMRNSEPAYTELGLASATADELIDAMAAHPGLIERPVVIWPGRAIVAYKWSFGDGRGGSGQLISHRFSRPGAYRVMLRAVDSWGDWGLYARTIRSSARR